MRTRSDLPGTDAPSPLVPSYARQDNMEGAGGTPGPPPQNLFQETNT